MSNAKEFEELLRADEALQEKMRVAFEDYAGDKSDERAVFEAIVAPLADEVGLSFTYDDVLEFASDDESLNLDDLDAAAGGGCCFAIGGTKGAKAYGSATGGSFGGMACVEYGVGFFYVKD